MYYTWNELFWIFFSYSFVGWCAGVITNAFRRKKFVNTGFLNLPLCPIYGIIGIAYGILLIWITAKFLLIWADESIFCSAFSGESLLLYG